MTLEEMERAGAKASAIRNALERLKDAEHRLKLVNRYAAEKQDRHWEPELCLERSAYSRDVIIKVAIPFDYIKRQAINAVIDARRMVVQAGGELPPASEQVQRGGR